MTSTDSELVELLQLPDSALPDRQIYGETSVGELARIMDENNATVDRAYAELYKQVAELRAKPPRERRTGAAARMNPDDIRLGRGVLWGTAVFGAAAFLVSFGGQYAMAPYTQLPEILWWAVPFFIEAPIILLSFMIAVFRRRKQHTALPWIVIIGLTALSSAINVAHVYIESGGLQVLGDWFGAVVMGLAPWLVLIAFEELVRLAVKPTDPEPAPPARKPAPKNRSTKR
jgi:hypothetical protein